MPDLPPIKSGGYLLDYFWEIGPSQHTGMGQSPTSHAEILAWQTLMGLTLEPWEVRGLRRMSVAYINTSQAATEPGYPAPWKSKKFAPEPAQGNSLKDALRALSKL